MTDKQNAYFNMFLAVFAVFKNHREKWKKTPVLKAFIEAFETLINTIRQKSEEQAALKVKATSSEKSETKIMMVESAIKEVFLTAARILNFYALNINDHKLWKRTTGITKNTFYNSSDNESLKIATGIAKIVEEHLNLLADYELTSDLLAAFNSQIEAFASIITTPHQVVNMRKVQRERLEALFTETRSLIIVRINKMMMVIFKISDPVFYAENFSTRRCINMAMRNIKSDTGYTEGEK